MMNIIYIFHFTENNMKINHVFSLIIIIFTLVNQCEAGTWTNLSDAQLVYEYCNSAPAWKLNLCNITCRTCSNTNNYQC